MSALREQGNTTWYDVAVTFCDTKWKRWAPRSRKSAAEALATVTAVLVDGRGGPDQRERRRALEHWTFNTSTRRQNDAPEATALTVAWLREHSIPLARLADPAMVRLALDALSSKLDGSPAAATTTNRKRMVFHQALEFAVERGLIEANPLDRIKWKKPKTAEAIDRMSVVNPTQARALLRAVSEIDDTLTLFFALMYFAPSGRLKRQHSGSKTASYPPTDGACSTSLARSPGWRQPGSIAATPTSLALSSTAHPRKSAPYPPAQSWWPTSAATSPITARHVTADFSAGRAAIGSRRAHVGTSSLAPGLRRSRPEKRLHRWFAAPTTCDTPPSPPG